jgi:uncharacterized protein YndB with AHSA1/START domain
VASEEVARWWGSDDLYWTTSWTGDLRVGGRWRSEGKGKDGQPFHVEGEFLEIDPPHRLVHTWQPVWEPGETTTVSYRLEAITTGTRVTIRHEGFGARADSCSGHAAGWQRVLGWLGAHLMPGLPETFFLVRLLPPRPTFMTDMSEDERAMMMQHARYWTELLAVGTAVVFGPVADPKGGWGLGVVRAEDEAAVKAIEAKDPAIAGGRGLRYEVTRMLTAVFRD